MRTHQAPISIRGFLALSASSLAAATLYRQARSTKEDAVRHAAHRFLVKDGQLAQRFGRPLSYENYNVSGDHLIDMDL